MAAFYQLENAPEDAVKETDQGEVKEKEIPQNQEVPQGQEFGKCRVH